MNNVALSQGRLLTIVLADDHSVFRRGLRELLQGVGAQVVSEVNSGEEAVRQTLESQPDVVVMDVRMPGMDGIQATREIKAASPDTEVVVLSAYDQEEQVIEALQAGARGYVRKDDDPAEVIEAVRVASAGELYLGPSLARNVLMRLAAQPQEARRKPERHLGRGE